MLAAEAADRLVLQAGRHAGALASTCSRGGGQGCKAGTVETPSSGQRAASNNGALPLVRAGLALPPPACNMGHSSHA